MVKLFWVNFFVVNLYGESFFLVNLFWEIVCAEVVNELCLQLAKLIPPSSLLVVIYLVGDMQRVILIFSWVIGHEKEVGICQLQVVYELGLELVFLHDL